MKNFVVLQIVFKYWLYISFFTMIWKNAIINRMTKIFIYNLTKKIFIFLKFFNWGMFVFLLKTYTHLEVLFLSLPFFSETIKTKNRVWMHMITYFSHARVLFNCLNSIDYWVIIHFSFTFFWDANGYYYTCKVFAK